MTETEKQREERASEVAYAKGRRDAEVDGRLNNHENRLKAINGSIEKHARQAAALKASIEDLREDVADVAATLKTKAEIEADRAEVEKERVQQIRDANETVARANEKQISARMFWLGVATICVMILVAFYAKTKGVG